MARKPPSWWFEDARVPITARALSHVYGAAVSTRRWLYDKGLKRSRAVHPPVIVVGNLIAGGSGKTPLAIALVERLRAEGWTPGVASRGYGRENDKRPLWVEPGTDPRQGGDEPVLIATRTDAKVRVDRDRAAAASALAKAGCNVIVCDDGLQHYRLRRDIEIEVIDGRRRYGNGRLIPAGPLRERPERSARCDFRVVNGGSETIHDPASANGPCAWTPASPGRCSAAVRCRWKPSPTAASTPSPALATPNASLPPCAPTTSPSSPTPSPTTTATTTKTSSSAATSRSS